jgi:hypothetical protein
MQQWCFEAGRLRHFKAHGMLFVAYVFSSPSNLNRFSASFPFLQAGLNPRTATLAGTPWYMAPEVIQSDTHDYGVI